MGKPSAPKPPDPKDTAAASTGTSVATAIANTQLGNMNQSNPFGSLTYGQTGTTSFKDPFTGVTYEIPQFGATTTLSPEQQKLYDQSVGAQTALGAAGMKAAQGFTPTQAVVPEYMTSAGLNTQYGTNDYSADRNEYEAAMMARMQPMLDQQQAALDASLANQGIGYGAEAFNDAQFTQSQAENDAMMAAILAGGQEQQRMFEMEMAAQNAGNNALQQEFVNNNSALSTGFTQGMQSQNDYMNQILSLLGASQPTIPQFTPNTPSPIPTTDTAGIINNNYSQQQANYNQQMQQWNSMWGNLFGLGGDIVGVI
jgi:hypothetical protein